MAEANLQKQTGPTRSVEVETSPFYRFDRLNIAGWRRRWLLAFHSEWSTYCAPKFRVPLQASTGVVLPMLDLSLSLSLSLFLCCA